MNDGDKPVGVAPLRLVYADLPAGRTPIQMAFEAALRGREPTAVVPPPLYVVMGYKVRDEDKKVEITSNEFVWRTYALTKNSKPGSNPRNFSQMVLNECPN